MKFLRSVLHRRSFFIRFGGTAGAFAMALAPEARGQRLPIPGWEPTREAQDDWLDKIPGKHRMMFDSTEPAGFASALMYANNFYMANKDGYRLQDDDLAVVIVARHHATPFAFNDAMWKKYGGTIYRLSNFTDPKTKQQPVTNVYMESLNGLVQRGVRVAVCEMATRDLAQSIAEDVKGNADTVFNELAGNLVSNSHLVAAGIVAVNRAQEHGYAFVNA